MPDEFLLRIVKGFTALHREVDKKGGEFDFRYSLAEHLFEKALGWKRKEGEGHFVFEEERKDMICYDDASPPFPVIVVETKRPSKFLDLKDINQLKGYLDQVQSARYGVLTNGKELVLYHYMLGKLGKPISRINIERIAEVRINELEDEETQNLRELRRLERDRFVKVGDAEFFENKYKEISIKYEEEGGDIGYRRFVDALERSLEDFTDVLMDFFDSYMKRDRYAKEFLNTSFNEWKKWRAYTGAKGKAKEAFCRETAYIILNRILFARICEDKVIIRPPRLSGHRMADYLRSEKINKPYLEALRRCQQQTEKHYEHLYQKDIFDWWRVEWEKVDMEKRLEQQELERELDYAVGNVLKRLNRFDFRGVNRDILGHVYEDYLPKEERKELGEFYTPIEVVRYILDSVGYKTRNNIGNKKILDPACGSGTFLTEAADRLIEHYKRKFGKPYINQLSADEAKKILERIHENIYGIDINRFATYIAEINLLFKTIDLHHRVRQKYRDLVMPEFNIHCADTLMGTESEMESGQKTLRDFSKWNARAETFVKEVEKVDKIKEEVMFDFVVANPPYVRIQNIKSMKEHYSQIYDTAIKNFDIYVPFIQRGLKWLKDRGTLGYIHPNRMLSADYGKKLREKISKLKIEQLIDFKETGVFDASTPYPIITIVRKSGDVEDNRIKCVRVAVEMDDFFRDLRLHFGEKEYEIECYDLFEYPQSLLSSDIWALMPEDERKVFEKIQENSDYPLDKICEDVFVGMQTSADPIYIGHITEEISDKIVKFRPLAADKKNYREIYGTTKEEFEMEKDILRKVLKGQDIVKWGVNWRELWIIFPYEVENGNARLMSKEKLQKDYGKVWNYFGVFENALRGREGGKLRDKKEWYGHIYRKNLEKFDQDKIMTQVLSEEGKFTPDIQGEFYFTGGGGSGVYGLHLNSNYATTDDYYYFTAILNSRILEFFHKHISPIFGAKYYVYAQRFLKHHPIVDIKDKKLRSQIVEIAKNIQNLHKEKSTLERKTSSFAEEYATKYSADKELIDLAENVDLGGDLYRIQPIRLDGKKLIMKKGHTLTFKNQGDTEFAFELLKSKERVSKSELLSMKLPSSKEIKKCMEKYRSDVKQIEKAEEQIKDVQEKLDNIIAIELYGLSKEDIDIIDKFLEKW
jgi:type I restriction-modification system DNA methylase subunit